MASPVDYKHIKAWLSLAGGNSFNIQSMQNRASKENAPIDAIYCSIENGVWRTLDYLSDRRVRFAVEDLVKRYKD